MDTTGPPVRGWPAWPQWGALAVGVFGLVLGVAGLVQAGLHPFTGPAHERVAAFDLNGLHNVVHVVLGVSGLVAARTVATARAFGLAVFYVFVLVAVLGMGTYPSPTLNLLGVNGPDNTMHAVVCLVGLAIAWGRPAGRHGNGIVR
jgi:uncharacterized protein DUF4383